MTGKERKRGRRIRSRIFCVEEEIRKRDGRKLQKRMKIRSRWFLF